MFHAYHVYDLGMQVQNNGVFFLKLTQCFQVLFSCDNSPFKSVAIIFIFRI